MPIDTARLQEQITNMNRAANREHPDEAKIEYLQFKGYMDALLEFEHIDGTMYLHLMRKTPVWLRRHFDHPFVGV